MKKIARRSTVVCTALGIAREGSLVSPAATPTTSVPENANTTVSRVEKIGAMPLGNQPSATKLPSNGAEAWPAIGIEPKIASRPITMNAMMANTLIDANQNSASPYSRTDMMLSANTTAMNTADHTQDGE